jgi:methylmalonyl-CoA mutase cobalamin-binding domain/chain
MTDQPDLASLETPVLLTQIHDHLYRGHVAEVVARVNELLARGLLPYEVLIEGLVHGMEQVGIDFRKGILFVPQVLLAAKAMKAGMEILRPLLVATGAPRQGTMVIGTVKGDIHDIGQNLVAMMMEGAGFQVVRLGVNNDVDKFMAAVQEHQPEIVGMSAMLTTTMPYMRVVIRALQDAGLREGTIVLVGGAPLNDALAAEMGADAYCRDAAVGVQTAKRLMAKRPNPAP